MSFLTSSRVKQCAIAVNSVLNWSLSHWSFYISSRQISLKFEIWSLTSEVLVLCPRGVSPSLITIIPRDGQCVRRSTWWLTKWLLFAQCFTVSDYYVRFGIVRLQAARCPVVRDAWYRRYSRYLRRLTIFFTATIYRGIPWLWRYWYRHASIDDKYRGIAGIAQH